MMAQSAFSAIAITPKPDFRQAVFAVLDGAAREIKRFCAAMHNKCPLVVYIDKAGKTRSQFLRRSLFTGYHFRVEAGTTTVTNRETGAQYSVVLGSSISYCTCSAYKYSPLPKQPCKHLLMVAQKRGDSEQVAKQETAIAPSFVGIDETNLPVGCTLSRTDDNLSREFDLFVRAIKRIGGVPTNTTVCVGRLLEGLDGIRAFKLTSGIYRSFPNTLTAVKYLVSTSGHSLKEIEAAFDAWDTLALDF